MTDDTETEQYRLHGGAFIGLTKEFEASPEYIEDGYDPGALLRSELEDILGEEVFERLMQSDVYIEFEGDTLTRR
jgi:hypothetical protein